MMNGILNNISLGNQNKKVKSTLWVVDNGSVKDDKFVNVLILNKKESIGARKDPKLSKVVSNVTEKQISAQIPKSFLCSKCGKGFSSNFNLKRHMSSCKLCPDDEKGPRHQCECGRNYAQEWDMKKHKASCQQNNIAPDQSKCKKCPYCSMLFYHRLQLQTHMKLAHNVIVEDPQVYDFESIDDFKTWKESMEEDTYTYYSKQTGGNVTGVSVNTYYVCQHDGSDRVHSSEPRKTDRRNKKGRVKTGITCWSQMNVKEFRDGTVRVTYHPSHTHPVTATDTKHHPLPPSITDEIQRRVLQVNEEEQSCHEEDSPDAKKAKRKGYSLNARNLRALARKNRKLFRITAEAVNEVEEVKQAENDSDPPESVKPPELQLQCEVKDEDVATSVLASNWYFSQLKFYLDSGKLSASTLFKAESVLSNLVDTCRRDVLSTDSVSGCPQIATDYSSPDESQPVYQVVTLSQKEETHNPLPTEELVYQNAVDLVGHRDFIFIAHDPQVFHSAMSPTSDDL